MAPNHTRTTSRRLTEQARRTANEKKTCREKKNWRDITTQNKKAEKQAGNEGRTRGGARQQKKNKR